MPAIGFDGRAATDGLMCVQKIQDGGDAYSVPPKWVPFRRFIGRWGSVALGCWAGGLLGYKPFFKEYTTDWDYAVAKMKGS